MVIVITTQANIRITLVVKITIILREDLHKVTEIVKVS